ncbi:MAG: hypothetical protein ABIG30_00025 [Candidatus Aenigmatarchaeota archaeon]
MGLDSIVYAICTIISFFMSVYIFKIYKLSSEKSHLYLYYGFLILTVGLFMLSAATIFNFFSMYINGFACNNSLIDMAFSSEDMAYSLYYVASIIAYIIFAFSYTPSKHSQHTILPMFFLLPFWYTGFKAFHVISLFVIFYIILRSMTNFIVEKNSGSLLVSTSFSLIGLYHFFFLLIDFSNIFYVLAHLSLLFGFLALLATLVQISR